MKRLTLKRIRAARKLTKSSPTYKAWKDTGGCSCAALCVAWAEGTAEERRELAKEVMTAGGDPFSSVVSITGTTLDYLNDFIEGYDDLGDWLEVTMASCRGYKDGAAARHAGL